MPGASQRISQTQEWAELYVKWVHFCPMWVECTFSRLISTVGAVKVLSVTKHSLMPLSLIIRGTAPFADSNPKAEYPGECKILKVVYMNNFKVKQNIFVLFSALFLYFFSGRGVCAFDWQCTVERQRGRIKCMWLSTVMHQISTELQTVLPSHTVLGTDLWNVKENYDLLLQPHTPESFH